jgi:hypothetical protein
MPDPNLQQQIAPKRIRLSRTKGWRKPLSAITVLSDSPGEHDGIVLRRVG